MSRAAPTRLAVMAIASGVLALCLYLVARSFDWQALAQVAASADPLPFFAGGTASLLTYWLVRAARWGLLLRKQGVVARPLDIYLINAIATGISVITPMQAGEALKIELGKQRGYLGRAGGYGGFLLERLVDFAVVVLLALVGLARAQRWIDEPRTIAVLAAGLLALLGAGLLLVRRLRLPGPLGELLLTIATATRDLPLVAAVTALTLTGWILVALGWQACFAAVSLHLELATVLSLSALVALVNLLSLVPGGIGVAELGISVALTRLGVPAVQAQAAALSIRAYTLLIVAMALLHYLAWRLRERRPGRPPPPT